MKRFLGLTLALLVILFTYTGCTQASRVSANLSQEADNFNVTRQITVINTRARVPELAVLYQITGNFSVLKSSGDLDIVGENPDGTYYKHFIRLTDDVTYTVVDLSSTSVSKHQFEINFNPKMILPAQPVIID